MNKDLKKLKRKKITKDEWTWLLMIAVPVLFVFTFCYITMYGNIIAFQRFIPAKGFFGDQQFIGFDNFKYIFSLQNVWRAIFNTISISVWKLLLGIIVPVVVAVLLNEVSKNSFKRTVQTIIYLPHFLSWVILAGIFIDILAADGIVNNFLGFFGIEPLQFLGSNDLFQGTLIVTDVWKGFGYSSVIYLASITAIDTGLYESAKIDGASRFQCIWYITLPALFGIISLMAVLSIGNLLNAGFEQVLNLYSPQVYETGDIIDTFVYRLGLLDAKYGPAQAVSLVKSLISTVLTIIAYWAAYKYADYTIF